MKKIFYIALILGLFAFGCGPERPVNPDEPELPEEPQEAHYMKVAENFSEGITGYDLFTNVPESLQSNAESKIGLTL